MEETIEPQSAPPIVMKARLNLIYDTLMRAVGDDAIGGAVNNQGLANIDGQLANEAPAAAASAGGGDNAAAQNTQARPQQYWKQVQIKKKIADLTNSTSKMTDLKDISKTDADADADADTPMPPVSILAQLLSRRGIVPAYELVQTEGAGHELTFRYRVSFNEKNVLFAAMGAGYSKKEAKHAAARALIDKLTNKETGVSMQGEANAAAAGADADADAATKSSGAENASAVALEDIVSGNPISCLQDACISRGWPVPIYKMEADVNLPHQCLYTIACTLMNYREVGKGKSKRTAKRLAAQNMWKRLNENPLQADENNDALRNDSEFAKFHKQMKNATGKKILKLQKTCTFGPNTDFQTILAEIAAENNFKVTFVEIEEKSFNNEFQCLLQLSTLPVLVCYGSGDTMKEAKSMAARNALEYIKIMSKN